MLCRSAAAQAVDGRAFEQFMQASRPVCAEQPGGVCVGLALGFADADGDRALSLDEVAAIRRELGDWALRHRDELSPPERSSLALGLLLADSLGLEQLHGLYDADGDGLVSRAELLADVTLDQRPLGETLLDPAAVDRAAIARRLGVPPALIESIAPDQRPAPRTEPRSGPVGKDRGREPCQGGEALRQRRAAACERHPRGRPGIVGEEPKRASCASGSGERPMSASRRSGSRLSCRRVRASWRDAASRCPSVRALFGWR